MQIPVSSEAYCLMTEDEKDRENERSRKRLIFNLLRFKDGKRTINKFGEKDPGDGLG